MKASIVGASGYSGAELVKILGRHPHVELTGLYANTAAGERVDSLYGWAPQGLAFEAFSQAALDQDDVIFLALPSGEAMNIAPRLAELGKRVIDLSGDYRLQDIEAFSRFYKKPHASAELIGKAAYGLPEWNRDLIQKSKLISNPGCYPTSAILPLAPLLKQSVIEKDGIVINSLSGVSGAGRKADLATSFVEVNENVKAYKIGVHQHIPEIKSKLVELGGQDVNFTFIQHLLPISRGIYTTITATLAERVNIGEVEAAYEAAYVGEPFVRFRKDWVPSIQDVLHTNNIYIGFTIDETSGKLVITSTIDNLMKGAAGQAVQNLNIMYGFNEQEGLR